jgi:hypothetical protein
MTEEIVTEMHIDKLTLKLSGRDGRAARRLAEQMVERLRRSIWKQDGGQYEESVRVQIPDAPGATTERLAERAAAEVVRKLQRN